MVWARFDDQAPDHPKLTELGDLAPLAGWLWFAATCYCCRYLTDGRISKAQLDRLWPFKHIGVETGGVPGMFAVGDDVDSEWLISALVNVGLLEENGVDFVVHDFLDYNPSRALVTRMRHARKVAGRKGGKQSARLRGGSPSQQVLEQELQQGLEHKAGSLLNTVLNPPTPTPTPTPRTTTTKKKSVVLTDDQFLLALRANPAYQGLDLDAELGKMDAWLVANPQRKKTRRFIVAWLNRVDKPVLGGVPPQRKKPEGHAPNCQCAGCTGVIRGER